MSLFTSIRPVVVRTRRWPVFARAYRAVHVAAKATFLSRLAGEPGAEIIVRERRAKDRFDAGISDVDVVVVLADDLTPREALSRSRAVLERIAGARRGLPITTGVHLLRLRELGIGAALGDTFVEVLRTYGRPADVLAPLPRAPETRIAARLSAVHVAAFNTLRAARHAIAGDGVVDRALVAHALEKADSVYAVAAGTVAATPRTLASTYGATSVSRDGTPGDVVASLARLDACLPLPGGAPVSRHARLVHPASALRDPLERWAAPLLRHDAIRSVALLVDSPAPLDVRLAVVLEPRAPSAEDALARIREHLARHGTPRIHADCPPLRLHLLTPTILERPACLRLASVEPWLRASAIVVGATLPDPRAGMDELARNIAIGLMFASADARERADRRPHGGELARAHSLIFGVFPAVRALMGGGEPRCVPTPATLAPSLRAQVIEALEAEACELIPDLVARGRRALL